MAFMEERKLATAVGLVLIIVVSLGVIFMFEDLFGYNLGKDFRTITGMATTYCKNTVGGIKCPEGLYESKGPQACPKDHLPVCTNACELDKINTKELDIVCPSYCEDICLPLMVANQLRGLKEVKE